MSLDESRKLRTIVSKAKEAKELGYPYKLNIQELSTKYYATAIGGFRLTMPPGKGNPLYLSRQSKAVQIAFWKEYLNHGQRSAAQLLGWPSNVAVMGDRKADRKVRALNTIYPEIEVLPDRALVAVHNGRKATIKALDAQIMQQINWSGGTDRVALAWVNGEIKWASLGKDGESISLATKIKKSCVNAGIKPDRITVHDAIVRSASDCQIKEVA